MRFIFNNSKYKDLRKVLRNNKTDVEDILWQYLRHSKLGFKFRRQASIGRYVVDFYCPSAVSYTHLTLPTKVTV